MPTDTQPSPQRPPFYDRLKGVQQYKGRPWHVANGIWILCGCGNAPSTWKERPCTPGDVLDEHGHVRPGWCKSCAKALAAWERRWQKEQEP